jgi:hypothetical protein
MIEFLRLGTNAVGQSILTQTPTTRLRTQQYGQNVSLFLVQNGMSFRFIPLPCFSPGQEDKTRKRAHTQGQQPVLPAASKT